MRPHLRLCHRLPSAPSPRPISKLSTFHPVPLLPDASISTFRHRAFVPDHPALLPRGHFSSLPLFSKWFLPSRSNPSAYELNTAYLSPHGDALVPLEYSVLRSPPSSASSSDGSDASTTPSPTTSFTRTHAPLSLFLAWTAHALSPSSPSSPPTTMSMNRRLYLAQCSTLDLPPLLRADIPTPDIVAHAGRGDIYDANIWIGVPPTMTPLHRDPNPNLLVQGVGGKVVRLVGGAVGEGVWGGVRERVGGEMKVGMEGGEGMMRGEEARALEEAVWGGNGEGEGEGEGGGEGEGEGGEEAEGWAYEARLGPGDALFIPKGWWHSVKGVGEGVTASVNWWFR